MGGQEGGTWRPLMVSDRRLGGCGLSCGYGWSYFTPRKIPWKFCVDIFIRSVSGMGGQEGGSWRMLRVLDWRLRGHCLSWGHGWYYFTPRTIPWKFCVDIFIGRVSGMGGQEGGTWRTLRVPDRRHGGYGHPWCYGWPWWTPRIISWKFQIVIFVFYEVINNSGVNGQPQ